MRSLPLLVGLITLAMGVRMPIGGGREEEERVKGGLNFGVGGGWRFGFLSFVGPWWGRLLMLGDAGRGGYIGRGGNHALL